MQTQSSQKGSQNSYHAKPFSNTGKTFATMNKTKPTAAPAPFYCSLSHQIMEDPVLSIHGYTFERCVIMRWLEMGNRFCPCTGLDMSRKDLITARRLREEIDMWRDDNDDVDEQEDSIKRIKRLMKEQRRSARDLRRACTV